MNKKEIGFQHGIPENQTKTWEKQTNGRMFQFKKAVERKGLFLYNCQCGASSRGFHSGQDLTAEEVEVLPQFASFIIRFTKT